MAMILKRVERPRELKWYQAGAMLYGDWGTSKAYVLGIAFALAGHASWVHLGLMSTLTLLVGFCYMIICHIYPDGGGVYSSVKSRSKPLALLGAYLLVADYTVTASLSSLDAFHYLGLAHPERWAIVSIIIIGILNWIGPAKGGSIAAIIAIFASISAGVLFCFAVPSLGHVDLSIPTGGAFHNWSVFVGIVLALSGAESIANLTGVMVRPVERTSKLSILPVMLEVSILTFLLGLAMSAIPGLTNHTEDMMRVMGNHFIGTWFGNLISILFAFLLLSAANTAIGGLVSLQFVLAKDREIPTIFSRLNRFGMPWFALLVAVAIPVTVLIFEHNLIRLAALYAIGVVGAIALNLGATATNKNLPLKKWERTVLLIGFVIVFFIEITIAFQKHNALLFALAIAGAGIALRYISKAVLPARIPEVVPTNLLTVSEAQEIAPLYQSSSLVALRTLNMNLIEEAALRAKALGENAVYLDVVEEAPGGMTDMPAEMEPAVASVELLSRAQEEMEKRGITGVPIWQMGPSAGRMIAQAAGDLGVKTVMIGVTRRGAITNLLKGDVVRALVKNLPGSCRLVISG
jgi:amino acid transporter